MGMKCDELKDYDPDFPFQSRGRFYDAEEVENAIDELKAAHHKERHEYIEMVAQLKAKLAEQEENIMNKKKINAFDCICVTDVRIIPINKLRD
jgi:hypothetical protein